MQKHSRKMKKAISEFAAKVRTQRENRGISRQRLSEELNINPITIRNLEQGKTVPMLDTALILSAELGIKLDRIKGIAANP